MNKDVQMIEQIVAEVVRRLRQLAEQPSAVPSSAPASAISHTPAPPSTAPPSTVTLEPTTQPLASADTLVLDARVVSTATVHGRLKGVRTVVVPERAVVTPSVKDDLQRRHIRLEYQAPCTAATKIDALTVERYTRGDKARRAMATLPMPGDAEQRVHDDLPTAVSSAQQAVQNAQHAAVLVTDEVLAAVCLLNRSAHVRAAHARTAEDVRHAIAAIGANVLVLDPRDVTANQWNVALQVFRKDLPRMRTNVGSSDGEE